MKKSILIVFLLFTFSVPTFAINPKAKVIYLDDQTTASIPISLFGTVLSFPTKPRKVVLGQANSFGIEYIDSDLVISPLKSNATSHLFVYLLERRFVFGLVSTKGDQALILVRDKLEKELLK